MRLVAGELRMIRLLVGFLFFSIVVPWSPSLQASKGLCSTLFKEFSERKAKAGKERKCYKEFYCHNNIHRLVLEIQKKAPQELEGLNVLYLSPSSGRLLPIHSFKDAIFNSSRGWTYHVVLEKDGRIYDFDFKNEIGLAPKVEEYFTEMFLPKSAEVAEQFFLKMKENKMKVKTYNPFSDFQKIMVSVVSAKELLRDYGTHNRQGVRRNTDYYVHGSHLVGRSWIQSVEEYILSFE